MPFLFDLPKAVKASSPTFAQRLLLAFLVIPSWGYRAVMRLRNIAFDQGWKKSHESPLPTISVGNLSVGGTGKSPAVAWFARELRARGVRVAILSRGYGQLDSGQNDEALELELRHPDVPHLQHWDRVASASLAAEELEMEVLLLDDGFQHRRITRDQDIVLLDATLPWKGYRPLPAGLLREPFASLKRASLAMITRSDQASAEKVQELRARISKAAPGLPVVTATHTPSEVLIYPDQHLPIDALTGKQVLAFCAIGNPESFFAGIDQLGVTIIDRRVWPDHHGFSAADISDLQSWSDSHREADLVLCTMKDWVKIQLAELAGRPLAALAIELQIASGGEHLEFALEAIATTVEENRQLDTTQHLAS